MQIGINIWMYYLSTSWWRDWEFIMEWSMLHCFCNLYPLGLADIRTNSIQHWHAETWCTHSDFFLIIWFESTAKLYVMSLWIDIIYLVKSVQNFYRSCDAVMRQRQKNIISHVNKETAIVSVKKEKQRITNSDVKRFTSVFLVLRFICEGNRS